MRYITSASTNDGVSQITVTFDLSRNLDVAAVDVQNRISTVTGRLPTEVNTTGITIIKNSSAFVLAAGFYSDDNRYNNAFISNYIDVYVKDALKRIPGVGDVMIFGERKYAMRLWLDPVRLAARGLTASDVVNALREQNVEIAAGRSEEHTSELQSRRDIVCRLLLEKKKEMREAIDHARAAHVPLIIAINKMDMASANPDRVKKELADLNVVVTVSGCYIVALPVAAR